VIHARSALPLRLFDGGESTEEVESSECAM